VLQAGERASADNGGCAQAGQFKRDGGSDSTSASRYQGNFAVQSMVHVLSILNFRSLLLLVFFFSACRNVLSRPVSNLAEYRVLPMDRSKLISLNFHIRQQFARLSADG
jgi:hypothetical protein